mmetsp:Transcript_25026/g.54874  ORF Transcript_25026/g.54874 Transcript_25026/m.54874 type:complete len:223 (+) Transcript_25026:95-763(+)|eukprot:CAMPEP_0168228486 /NCGR_PEP_ID=MMETSP0140_2-20121125/14701_1 /TAXON_ID=44445 /ORGANISM="Pseudo-nitzschia australis, Strain 10249 10 AB" /LENGTH=222 /DNA_ID=CAMNT_0008160101 /DNA_START=67 /DNA_END=735 /DNA_ORIENTATION=-
MDPDSPTRPSPPADTSNVTAVHAGDLPEGWSTAVSPIDGRVYYWNSSTGATSWTHPNVTGSTPIPAPPTNNGIDMVPSMGDFSGIIAARSTSVDDECEKDIEVGSSTLTSKTEYAAMTDKGDFHDYDPNQATIRTHRWYSILAFILFFPLGMIALCRSCSTVSKYKQGRFETAHDHSQQTLLFSRISCIIGVFFWSYIAYCFFAGPGPYVLEIPAEWWPRME